MSIWLNMLHDAFTLGLLRVGSGGFGDSPLPYTPGRLNADFVLDDSEATYVPGGLYNVSFAMIASPKKWAQISPSDRDLIAKLSGQALARRFGQAWDAADTRGQKAVADTSIQIVNADPQLVADIKARTAGLEKDWIDKVKAKGADGKTIVDALRAEIAALQKR